MIGAIAGDIIGSVFERHGINRPDGWSLFDGEGRSRFTDDTILTVATMDALLIAPRLAGVSDAEVALDYQSSAVDPDTEEQGRYNSRYFATFYKRYARAWPGRGYGTQFMRWYGSDSLEPYNSFGNGSAMRVGPVGVWVSGPVSGVLDVAAATAAATHNHPEGIRGAQAVALAVSLAYQGCRDIEAIRRELTERFGYDLKRTVAEIRPTYRFDVTCEGSVPEAIVAALEGASWEECVRLAISLGGDADTQAAMAGAIAEARFGVPEWIQQEARRRLPKEFVTVLEAFYRELSARAVATTLAV